ncbi:MAG: hypothetical protein FAF03_00545 [Epsilonproteobacteria bacterium]|nr:hypothetical protein [Campylobacterota bacterium]
MNRALVFAHYDKDNLVAPYVLVYLQALQSVASTIIFVSTSKLSDETKETLHPYCNKVVLRDNEGYDFMSYKLGLSYIDSSQYDEVILCNDSVYGPFYPLGDLFSTMQTKHMDMWGMTDNYELSYHLQSYFLVFRQILLQSDAFKTFWDTVHILSNKEQVIEAYEIGLSKHLVKHGFQLDAYSKVKVSLKEKIVLQLRTLTLEKIKRKLTSLIKPTHTPSTVGHVNPTLTLWKALIIDAKIPFIKRELLRDNPKDVNIDDVYETIQSISEYDVSLIQQDLARIGKVL